ncbi:MAG: hypothetical protein WA687_10835, partial [Solirubrobacterales bacterium]
MVRQARNYLAGAVSGTALIAIAVIAFVMLVSLQTLRDWPLAGIAGSGDESGVSDAAATGSPAPSVAASGAGTAGGGATADNGSAGTNGGIGAAGGNAESNSPPGSSPVTTAPGT